MAGNRTRINCLEGNYAYHYTTIAPWDCTQQRIVTYCKLIDIAQVWISCVLDFYTNFKEISRA